LAGLTIENATAPLIQSSFTDRRITSCVSDLLLPFGNLSCLSRLEALRNSWNKRKEALDRSLNHQAKQQIETPLTI
jgi:hypothetical protein